MSEDKNLTLSVTTEQRKIIFNMNEGQPVKGSADEKKRDMIYDLLVEGLPYDLSRALTEEQLDDSGPLVLNKKQATQLYALLKSARESNAVFYSAIRKTRPIREALAEYLGEVE
jgi:hypothetical protein